MSEYLTEEEELSYSAKMKEIKERQEAPDDVFELFVMLLSDMGEDGWGNGGFNNLRLVSKRCMQVVESVATRLTSESYVETLPVASLKRCKGIEHIRCFSLRSLVGRLSDCTAWSLYQHARSWILLKLFRPVIQEFRSQISPLDHVARGSRN